MTNRQAFMCKLIQMSDEEFADLFRTEIVDYIYAAKCDDCKKNKRKSSDEDDDEESS